jgi:YegS/Rv2252/BmrU family lipid kinase
MKIRVIVNPKAGAGAAGRKLPSLTRALETTGTPHELVVTSARGHATALAREAMRNGVDVIAVVGGDGTLNEVVQAYLDEHGDPISGPSLGVIPAGTGGDFRRTLGLSRDFGNALRRLVEAPPRRLDLGVLELAGDRGERIRRAFVNITSFGVSGRIDKIVNEGPKWMGGRLAFALGSVRAMSTYRNAPVSIRVDGKPWYEGRIVVAAVANGRYFGGGMQIAPRADVADGLFDVVVLGDLTFAEACRVGPRMYAGNHLGSERVFSTRGRSVEAVPVGDHTVYIDADGETPGTLPLKAWVLPGALTVRA